MKEPDTSFLLPRPSPSFRALTKDGDLPYIHTSFPAAPPLKLGMARCYATRGTGISNTTLPPLTVHRQDENQGSPILLNSTLPNLNLTLPSLNSTLPTLEQDGYQVQWNGKIIGGLPINTANYVQNYKTVMRLRGFVFRDIYGTNRGQMDKSTHGKEMHANEGKLVDMLLTDPGKKQKNFNPRPALNVGTLENKAFRLPAISQSQHSYNQFTSLAGATTSTGEKSEHYSVTNVSASENLHPTKEEEGARSSRDSGLDISADDEREESMLEQRVRETVCEYESTPGWTPRKKLFGRKLGNVVSSSRLSQLLESSQPLQMENFYNYYP